MTPLIQFSDVSFEYDHTPILKQVNCKIPKGEFIHVIGPNGGGKTTFLKLLMGFLQPSQGQVLINGRPAHKAQLQIAYVPQFFNFDKLFPTSVLEVVLSGRLKHLSFFGLFSRQDKAIAMKALQDVGMQAYAKSPIGELSGGQMQRVFIARALVSQPDILVLDEPTSCIDHAAEATLEIMLQKLKNKMTIIMVTHDLEHITKTSDRVLSVHGTVTDLKPEHMCPHMSMGLFHEEGVALV